MADTPTILFVCFHNAGRSPRAAGCLRALSGSAVEVSSGGSEPGGKITPIAIRVMSEEGIDISRAVPQWMTTAQVRGSDVDTTMGCGDVCPIFPGSSSGWELSDPRGSTADGMRPIRDDIRARIERCSPSWLP